MTLTFKRAIGKIVDAITSVKSVIDYIKTKMDEAVGLLFQIRGEITGVRVDADTIKVNVATLIPYTQLYLATMLKIHTLGDAPANAEDITDEATYRSDFPFLYVMTPRGAIEYVKIGGLIAYDSANGCRPWAACFEVEYDNAVVFIAKKITVKPVEGQTVHVERYDIRS